MALQACSGNDSAQEPALGVLELELSGARELASVEVQVTPVGDESAVQVIQLEPAQGVAVDIALPVGESYLVALDARTQAGRSCHGRSPRIELRSSSPTRVRLPVRCRRPVPPRQARGGVWLTLNFPASAPACQPLFTSLVVAPVALDQDAESDVLVSLLQSAPSGEVELTTGASAGSLMQRSERVWAFSCDGHVGAAELTFAAVSGSCESEERVTLECLPPLDDGSASDDDGAEPPDPGTGGGVYGRPGHGRGGRGNGQRPGRRHRGETAE